MMHAPTPRHDQRERGGAARFAIIALGSNLGDSRENILGAMRRLRAFSDAPVLQSSIWETTPVDCPPGSPAFANAVAAFEPRADETPESLLARLQAMEVEFGRKPKVILNEPRPLDLDLIAFRDETRNSTTLVLPHPRAHLRRFVLAPLAEIGPDWKLPGQNQTVVELLSAVPPDPGMRNVESS
ncbi:MAG TPA: 2-amino-4-hydroxy-6-hydroxymethyldihydropteridine diphosphokinase [Verrucomicrobiae bacterium]|nr:2-amino-4-hydroxy-6-hydroxymethyldihydropteridine diphosphokinase [Verrucomicrobiae bacterium]